MNVLVYSGPEVIQLSLGDTISTLRSLLVPNYSVQQVSYQVLKSQPWPTSCALLVFPRCRAGFPSSVPSINSFVENGGSLLAFGTGVQCSPRGISSFGSLSLADEASFRLYDRASRCYLTPIISPQAKEQSSITRILSKDGCIEGIEGLSGLITGFEDSGNYESLATYSNEQSESNIAGVKCAVGGGSVIFWSFNIEHPVTNEDPELLRKSLLRTTLTKLGLRVPSPDAHSVSRPLPQFLVGHPSKPEIVARIISAISGGSGSELKAFEDENDKLRFHEPQEYPDVKVEAQKAYLASEDPAAWQPKHIIVYPNGDLPDDKSTPLFQVKTFFDKLSVARSDAGCSTTSDTWGFGEALLYGEIVTSTQTMVDKNPRLLAALPTPFLSLASFQLAGRGRGSNIWLSPAGCLQFSLLLRVPLASFPTNKLVFVQYLFALAVTEACRDDSVLGRRGESVRIKWPNDLYAVFGPEDGDKKKIGGILVSTNFSGGKCDIIIGSGLNVLNPPPIFSLSQLQGNDLPLSMETIAAVILAKFEKMWTVFVQSKGSFESFMALYLDRWLHSDQLVTLTTMVPSKKVRVSGLTSDHGLLRTVPERTGWSSGEEGFIDLQPDGNSFDLMAGLIKSKSS
ncbi:class II aaRS and biotin synthetase [Desarmillaria tabescens]|uniref:Class II aaRS and biotin synthetase n=1 Tax=Armillaria tabescens TaxID=1929756 RepID=A0AA39NP34_ARMTA|nr:class II aaRS and biotin synthetase [Desarmillaria tabescens]KAK0469115.1 class II aaRS and biotin synthetase [Desarmillaria tabescens]